MLKYDDNVFLWRAWYAWCYALYRAAMTSDAIYSNLWDRFNEWNTRTGSNL